MLSKENLFIIMHTDSISSIDVCSPYNSQNHKVYEYAIDLFERLPKTVYASYCIARTLCIDGTISKMMDSLSKLRVIKFYLSYDSIESAFLKSINHTNFPNMKYLTNWVISVPKEEHISHFIDLWKHCPNLDFVKADGSVNERIP